MGSSKRVVARAVVSLVTVMVVALMLQLSHAAVYKVGDTAGWTSIGNLDYKTWSATKTFHVGDIIRFEYNAQFHNVMRVTHPMYKACNASAPLATYTTGNDTIKITTKGHHYFLCGVPGHCQSGQKVDINVLCTTETPPTPAQAPLGRTPALKPLADGPAPSPSSGISLKASMGSLIKLCLAMVAFVLGFH